MLRNKNATSHFFSLFSKRDTLFLLKKHAAVSRGNLGNVIQKTHNGDRARVPLFRENSQKYSPMITGWSGKKGEIPRGNEKFGVTRDRHGYADSENGDPANEARFNKARKRQRDEPARRHAEKADDMVSVLRIHTVLDKLTFCGTMEHAKRFRALSSTCARRACNDLFVRLRRAAGTL